jgi:hypothetical protein
VDDVVHLEHGLHGWHQAELPIEGEWAGAMFWLLLLHLLHPLKLVRSRPSACGRDNKGFLGVCCNYLCAEVDDDVVHLERGLYGWYQAELPIEGEWASAMCWLLLLLLLHLLKLPQSRAADRGWTR